MKRKMLVFVVALFVVGVSARIFLLSDLNPMFDNADFVFLKKNIDANRSDRDMDELVDLYLKTHTIVGPFSIRVSRKSGLPLRSCPSLQAVRQPSFKLIYKNGRLEGFFNEVIFAKKLESEFSTRDIVKFLFSNGDYLNGNKGVHEASEYYFHKKLAKLNQKELITLLLMYENASLYNPMRRQRKIDETVAKYQRFLDSSKR